MLKYKYFGGRTVGFYYFPLIEIGFGIFCIVCAIVFLGTFLYFNHHQLLEELTDTVLSFGVVAFFMFLGYTLTWNYMRVQLKAGTWEYFQCMTSPSTTFSIINEEFDGIRVVPVSEEGEPEPKSEIRLKTRGEEVYLYRTKNTKEVNTIVAALDRVYNENNQEELNDKN